MIWSDDLVNPDGFIYIRCAQVFLDEGWSAAQEIYPWPFFSVLVGILGTSGVSLEHSAYLLSSIFFVVIVIAFIRIVEELGGDSRVLIAAAFLILAHPLFNDSYRTYIIRDPGYWCFFLLALLAFLRFWKDEKFIDALCWGVSIIVAIMFRREGIAFLWLAPFLLWLKTGTGFLHRLVLFAKINIVSMSAALIFFFWKYRSGQLSDGRPLFPGERYIQSARNIFDKIEAKAQTLYETVIQTPFSEDYAVMGVLVLLGAILISKIVSTVTPLYFLFLCHGIFKRPWPSGAAVGVIVGFAAINFLVLSIFLFDRFFLTRRYVVPLMLLLLLITSFGLVGAYEQWRKKQVNSRLVRWTGGLVIALFCVQTLAGIISTSPSKAYIKEAGWWLKNNALANSNIFSNRHKEIAYYAGRLEGNSDKPWGEGVYFSEEPNKLPPMPISPATYFAIQVQKKDKEWLRWLQAWKGPAPVAEFSNEKGDKLVLISNQ